MQIHEEENPNYCHECQKGFSRKSNYKHHILTIHSANKEQFKCDICQGTFSSQSNLKRHTETMHSKDKHEFECNQCDKIFERLDNLHQHKRIEHNDQRKTIIIQGVNDKNEPFSC